MRNKHRTISSPSKQEKEVFEMGNLRAVLLVLFASSMALICSVHATCQDSTVFYWGADRGRYIGSDTVELMLNKSGGNFMKCINNKF